MSNDSPRVHEFRLRLYPKDYAKVRKFYEDTLNLPVFHEWNRPGSRGVMFDVGGSVLELLTSDEKHQTVQNAKVSWGVADVWKLWDELKDTVTIVHELRENSWGDSSFAVADPEGFEIAFFSYTKK